jgi:tetratricopeptide (TPR) repeat protein
MNTSNSKNFNTGSINASGNVNIGDKIIVGSITINLQEAKQYKDLQNRITDLNARFDGISEKAIQYPEDNYFKEELYKIDKERDEVSELLRLLKKEIIELAELFNRIDINTEALKLAKGYFEAGDFQQARNALDVNRMTSELNYLLEEKNKLENKTSENEKMLQHKSDEFLILARLTTAGDSPTWFDDTKLYYEKSIKAYPNKDNIFSFANFLTERNQPNEALELYNQLFDLYEQPDELSEKNLQDWVAALNNRAITLDKYGKTDEAKEAYTNYLNITRKLNIDYPDKFLPSIAAACLNFGNLLERSKNLDAESFYRESLDIRRGLFNKDPDTYAPFIISSLVGLGIFCANNDKHESAAACYSEALKMCNELVDINPNIIYPLLSFALINWVNFRIKVLDSENDKARPDKIIPIEVAIERALGIQEILCSIDYNRHCPGMATIFLNKGLLYTYISPHKTKALSAAYETIRYATPFANNFSDSKAAIETAKYIIDFWNSRRA